MSYVDRPWGGAIKVSTAARESYDQLVDTKNPQKFSRLYDAFHAAAAVGIRRDQTAGGKREELFNVYSMDPEGVYWALMCSLYPDASGQERFEKLMGHADFGIQRLAEQFAIFGNLQSAVDAALT